MSDYRTINVRDIGHVDVEVSGGRLVLVCFTNKLKVRVHLRDPWHIVQLAGKAREWFVQYKLNALSDLQSQENHLNGGQ